MPGIRDLNGNPLGEDEAETIRQIRGRMAEQGTTDLHAEVAQVIFHTPIPDDIATLLARMADAIKMVAVGTNEIQAIGKELQARVQHDVNKIDKLSKVQDAITKAGLSL